MILDVTPSQIINHLDRYVKGQQQAKRTIAVALYNHLLHIAYRDNSSLRKAIGYGIAFNPQHLLTIGATGSGKSYLIQKATEFIDLPCTFVSAAGLVQAGYVGTTIAKMMESHYKNCGSDLDRAERSIVFIDEIDKIRSQPHSSGPDVSGEGVQNTLLTLLDGKPLNISTRYGDDLSTGQKLKRDTEKGFHEK